MDSATRELFQQAMQLSEAERAELAARLIASLDPEVDRDVEAAWDAEIKTRLEQFDSGEVTAVPWPKARRILQSQG